MAATTHVAGRARAGRLGVFGLVLALAATAGCAGPGGGFGAVAGGALRISEVVGSGDPTRRASTRLVLEGLDSGDRDRARSHYLRAIQIDPTNPYAYLVLASDEIQWGDVDRGMQSLNQAVLLLQAEAVLSPRVEPHILGLRGRARLRAEGDGPVAVNVAHQKDGASLLEQARRLAPEVWGDGWLVAAELR